MTAALGAPSMRDALLRLRNRGFQPKLAVDGGACVGEWSILFQSVFPQATLLMIEPQRQHAERLRRLAQGSSGRLHFIPSLLGPPGLESVEFTVLNDDSGGTGSSVLPENSHVARSVEHRKVCTMDALVADLKLGAPDFVKLDVQGYELEVLKGATAVMEGQPLLLLELSFVEYNVGAPLAHDVIGWLAERDFLAAEIVDLSRRDDVLVQMDVLFIPRRLRAALQGLQPASR
jgi:FkbM family methyltransferase